MQDAATVLDVIGKRGARGLPVERLYRQLFNPQLFLMAYGKLYSNRGAMTPGVTGETVDGMSLAKIGAIIGALRAERYRWQPVKRVYIEKKNSSKKRPLGLPTWSDKLVAEVVRLLLEAYYEPQFSDRSHGFRPGRGCHTALSEVVDVWKGTHWFIEGDISDCFGSLDHEVMLATLAEKIHDGRFLQLVSRMLKGQKATGRPLRRDTPPASAHSHPHRPAACHGQRQAERADTPAPRRTLSTLRGHGGP